MLFKARSLAAGNRYDAVHAVEEAAFIARSLKRSFGLPYIYDMDSSLAEQMLEKYPLLRPLARVLECFEKKGAARQLGGDRRLPHPGREGAAPWPPASRCCGWRTSPCPAPTPAGARTCGRRTTSAAR